MKKLWLIISLLFAINFASAVDLSKVLGGLDSSLVVLVALFLITFSLAFFALNKVFKDNPTMAGIIAGAVAFLAVYGLNKIQFNTEDFFLNIGVSESAFSLVVFIIIIVGLIFMFIKMKQNALLVLGAVLVVLSLFVYAKSLLMTLGIAMLIVWFVLKVSKKKDEKVKIKRDKKSGYIRES